MKLNSRNYQGVNPCPYVAGSYGDSRHDGRRYRDVGLVLGMNGGRHRDVHDGYNLPNYMLADDGGNSDYHRLAEGNNSALRHNYADNPGTLGNTKSGNGVDGWRKRLIGLTQ